MVERVAEELVAADAKGYFIELPWEDMPETDRKVARAMARSAIAAMQSLTGEPT